MSDNKNDIFSSRNDQFKNLKNKYSQNPEDKEFIEKDEIMNDILNEEDGLFEENTSQNNEVKSMLEMMMESGNSYGDPSDDIYDTPSSSFDNNYELPPTTEEDVTFSYDDIPVDINIEDDSMYNPMEDQHEDISISIEDENDNSYVIGDGDEEDSIMRDMLSSIDSQMNEDALHEAQQEVFETPSYEPIIAGSEENFSPIPEDDGSYSQSEIDSHRNTTPGKNKDVIIKIVVGVVALIAMVLVALFVSKLINKNLNQPGTKNPAQSQLNSQISESTNVTSSTTTNSIVDDIIGDMSNQTIVEEEISTVNPGINIEDTSEDFSMLKNYKGYVVDIKDDTIYIADLTYDKYNLLLSSWAEFQKVEDTSTINVYVNDEDMTYHTSDCAATEYDEENTPDQVSLMTLEDALAKEYKPYECAKDLTTNKSIDPKDFDYSLIEGLNGLIYKSMAVSETSNIMVTDLTIGSQVTATYIQDNESLLNELIELKEITIIDDGKDEIKPGEEETKTETTVSTEGINVWGEEWRSVVATINDRRRKEDAEKNQQSIYDDNGNLLIGATEKYESVSTPIDIGSAKIVWFKINWKTNKDVKDVPDINDVSVAIKTPNNSLINEDNISNYGKIWVDESNGLVNIVLRNTIAGKYEVVFIKEVGTYLGDVTIEAIPITGFLQLTAADAVYTDGKLEVIWNAVGVSDDNCIVEIYAINGSKKVLIYSANSLDDGIHTVDMASINVGKIGGNTYDILICVTDIDLTAATPKQISARYLTDTVTIENVDIPEIIQK